MDELSAMDELRLDIEQAEPGSSEREELELTYKVCQELLYGIEEGFIDVEEQDDGELLFFSESSYDVPPIEA